MTFQKTVELVRHYKNGHAVVMAFNEDPRVKQAPPTAAGYLDQYMRTRAMYKFSLILSSDGSVQPLLLAMPAPAPGSGKLLSESLNNAPRLFLALSLTD